MSANNLPQMISFLQVRLKTFISLPVTRTISIIPNMLEEPSKKRRK